MLAGVLYMSVSVFYTWTLKVCLSSIRFVCMINVSRFDCFSICPSFCLFRRLFVYWTHVCKSRFIIVLFFFVVGFSVSYPFIMKRRKKREREKISAAAVVIEFEMFLFVFFLRFSIRTHPYNKLEDYFCCWFCCSFV